MKKVGKSKTRNTQYTIHNTHHTQRYPLYALRWSLPPTVAYLLPYRGLPAKRCTLYPEPLQIAVSLYAGVYPCILCILDSI